MSAKSKFKSPDGLVILVAEDDPDDELFLKMAFENAGIRASLICVNNGGDVIAYLKGAAPFGDRKLHPRPNLLLLDLQMPRICGLEVLEWLRTQPLAIRVPAVVFTGQLTPEMRERATALGARACLEKTNNPGRWGPIVLSLQRHCHATSDVAAR